MVSYMNFFKKTKGAISIFLVLIMLPMFTCAGLIVDGARISAARTSLTGAGDLAMNAALSEYDAIVQDVYGLFAMSESQEELEENVSRYFSNTLNNAGILEESDSYTRSFINSIGSMFSTGDISFDNIVDTQVESFELVEVPNSALANPTVMNRQIVEYMKYRGPVNIGSGLLSKLGCIGETSKQTKVLEAKVNYEKKLDSVQDACETAYNAINTFNTTVDGTNYKGDYLTALNNDLATSEKRTKEMAEYIIAAKSPSLKVSNLSVDSNLKKSVTNEIKKISGDDKEFQAYKLIKDKLKPYVEFQVNDKGEYKAKQTEYVQNVDNYYSFGPGSTFQSQINYILNVNTDKSTFNKMYTYLSLMDTYYNKLSKEEREEYKDEYGAYAAIKAQLYVIVTAAQNASSGWKTLANEKGSAASSLLYDNWYSKLTEIDTSLQDAIDALEAVIKKTKELDGVRIKWKNSLDNLSESDIKTSMSGDYENSAKDINEDAVNSLIKVLKDNQTHFNKIKEKLESVKFYEQKICVEKSSSIDYYNRFSSIPEFTINGSNTVTSRADSIMNKYVNANVKTGITPATYIKIDESQQFYKYLKNMFANSGTSTETKKSATKLRDDLITKGNSTSSTTADTKNVTTGKYVTDSGLTAEISKAISDLAGTADTFPNSFNPGTIDSKGNNDKMADDGKANLTQMSSLLENLSNLGENVRDKIYLEEYFTEMFSCYTSGKGPNGTTVAAKTLSNKDMSTNKFYRSEVEYILWGKDTVEGNLNATKGMIFGVRFALNSVYAFTSSDTRTPALSAATAIAGWTGFGVPIVQSVILLAWSMAESIVDVDNLCKGEAVCIYKSKDTWVLGINGAKNKVKELASKTVDDVFDKINNVAMDSISNIETDVQEYVTTTTNSLKESITSSVMTHIERLTIQIIGESNYDLQKPDVEKRVDDMLNSLLSSASGDDVSQKATRLAINKIQTGTMSKDGSTVKIKDYIVDTIYTEYTNAKNGITSEVSKRVESFLDSLVKPIEDEISSTISSVGDELKTQVSDIIKEGGDQVKEKVTTAIEDYMGKIGGEDGKGKNALASGLTLTYKEYLKMFILINVIGNENAMLQRCAELIQANVSQKNTSFNISKAYTMVEVNATASIKTTFFNVPVSTGVDAAGNPIYDLDFGRIGADRQNLKYVGILGY